MHFSKIAPVVALAAGVSASYVPEVEPYVPSSTYDVHSYEHTPVHYPEYPQETPAYPHESPIHYPESSSAVHYPEVSPIHYPESSSAVHYPEVSPIHYPESSAAHYYPEASPIHYPETSPVVHYPEQSPEHYPAVTASPYPEHDYTWEYYHTKYTTSEVCSYETTTTDKYEVYCPEPTTYVYGKHSYVVDKPKTLTLIDGPYTVTHPVYTAVVVDCTTSTKVAKPTYHATKDGKDSYHTKDGKDSYSTKDGKDSYPTKDGEVSYPTKDGQGYTVKPEQTHAPVKTYPSGNATAISPYPNETGSIKSPEQEQFYGAASRTTFSAASLAVVFGLFAYML